MASSLKCAHVDVCACACAPTPRAHLRTGRSYMDDLLKAAKKEFKKMFRDRLVSIDFRRAPRPLLLASPLHLRIPGTAPGGYPQYPDPLRGGFLTPWLR